MVLLRLDADKQDTGNVNKCKNASQLSEMAKLEKRTVILNGNVPAPESSPILASPPPLEACREANDGARILRAATFAEQRKINSNVSLVRLCGLVTAPAAPSAPAAVTAHTDPRDRDALVADFFVKIKEVFRSDSRSMVLRAIIAWMSTKRSTESPI
ncbi:hypothetical protein EVAR_97870_1 [Eumeta japonica]|uniref:Uncharacterized protein n=1 Tax=Eumeta variegata TaxID=151549 RepID=A0A4C1WHG6_EUMVA|nr:hypothetical protein EVAR_97870_1 [Eumeta japonica]